MTLKATDVNHATIRQAVDDLEIGVPVRSWEVRDGKLLLHLAYAREPAVWSPPGSEEARPGSAGEEETGPPPIPDGNLDRLLKKDLQKLAHAHGVPHTYDLLKAELVAALEELRA